MGELKVDENGLTKENIEVSYLSMIKDASRILEMLSSVWRYCVSVILLSLSIIGLLSISMFVIVPGKEIFFAEGIIFQSIAAWIFVRNSSGVCSGCCSADIPRWKGVLASFVNSDNSVEMEKDGQSVLENLMQVILITGDWIRQIKRDVFSMLFWPLLASVIFVISLYPVDLVVVRVVEVTFVAYAFVLATGIFYGVNSKFHNWQTRVKSFKNFTSSALDGF
jgi:hypothetical protein